MIISLVNRASNTFGNLLMAPLKGASPWLAVFVFSLGIAVLALLVFKACSNQDKLRYAKGRLLAHVLELHLFQHDLPGIFTTFGRVLLSTFGYVKETLKPLAVMLIPMVLILIQAGTWLEFLPLQADKSTLVSLETAENFQLTSESIALAAPTEVDVETEAFLAREAHHAFWRIRPITKGYDGELSFSVGSRLYRKQLTVGSGLRKISSARVRDGIWNRLLHPVEPPLDPSGPVTRIAIAYPERRLQLGSWSLHWLVAVFALSLLFGFVLKYPLRVDF